MQLVAADIGGTHARFALAQLEPGERPRIGAIRRYRTREHAGLASAWAAFEKDIGVLPRNAALGVAAPVEGEILTFMNSDWRIDRRTLAADLGLERLTLVNDFGAVAHAVSVLDEAEMAPIMGPDAPLPDAGVITVLGAGTGLGVALFRRRGGEVMVIETEASHVAFAALNAEEEALRGALAARYGRVSIERIVSGPGLVDIHRFLGGGEWDPHLAGDLWQRAIDGSDAIAARALAILVRCFGAAAGDIALAQGAMGVAITGGLANRIAHLLRGPEFAGRFLAKGRYRDRMERIPVKLVTIEEPGLLGAAVAFQREWLSPSP
ncbi:MAG: glucokinase [Sphingomonadales bacterium]|jgi:glucokinase|nr:glucokinase [Sphingomonadales bacterium]